MNEESREFAVGIVSEELLGDTNQVRSQFVDRFQTELEEFIAVMAASYLHWKKFDSTVGDNTERAHISALLYGAINAHVISMKFLITGYLIPAGNTQRQAFESAAMALLCSKPELGFLKRYIDEKYSTNKAVRDIIKHHKILRLNQVALKTLKKSRSFYDNFSHPTFITLASSIGFSKPGPLFFGSSFDESKMNIYTKEMHSKVSFAGIINNIIDGVRMNLDG
jgi:hypothetical protein